MRLGYIRFSQKPVRVLGSEDTLPWARQCNKLHSAICIVLLSESVSRNAWLQQGHGSPCSGFCPALFDGTPAAVSTSSGALVRPGLSKCLAHLRTSGWWAWRLVGLSPEPHSAVAWCGQVALGEVVGAEHPMPKTLQIFRKTILPTGLQVSEQHSRGGVPRPHG